MEIRADRRRCHHRPREPTPKWGLSRFCECPGQHTDHPGCDHSVGGRVHQKFRDQVCASALADDDQSDQHHEPTCTGDQNRLQRSRPGPWVAIIVADQQVRGDGGQLPENKQCQEMVREHHPEHRPCKESHQTG